ncbi:unnamed protein product [Symbiodinium sp. CCMP2592]|nr:unnamed protein product [Symbiodinium sp. CCMP2592]
MPAMSDLKPAILAAGSLFMLAVLYLLLRDEAEEENGSIAGKDPKSLLKEVLTQLLDVEQRAKRVVEELVREQLSGKEVSIAEAYQRVEACDLVDPLEKQGLSIQEFEAMVAEQQNDPWVMESMVRLSGQHPADMKPGGADLDVAKILAMKEFALVELEKLVASFLSEPNAESKDFKAATVALKALVHAKVEKAHGVAADEVETAAVMKQEELIRNPDFVGILKRQQTVMQQLMSKLMAGPKDVGVEEAKLPAEPAADGLLTEQLPPQDEEMRPVAEHPPQVSHEGNIPVPALVPGAVIYSTAGGPQADQAVQTGPSSADIWALAQAFATVQGIPAPGAPGLQTLPLPLHEAPPPPEPPGGTSGAAPAEPQAEPPAEPQEALCKESMEQC